MEDVLDLRTSAADNAFAEVVRNPRDQTVLGLQNLSNQAWSATGPSGGQKQLEPGKSLKLTGGTTINFGPFVGTIREGSGRFSLSLSPGRVIPLTAGVRLTTNDLLGVGTSSSARLIAEVERNPNDPTILGLKNLSDQGWSAVGPGSRQQRIDPGKSLKLVVGTTINFGGVEGEIKAALSRSFIWSGSGSRVRPGRMLLSMAVAFLLGVGARFLLGAFVHEQQASDHSQLVATLPVGPSGAQVNLPGGGYIDIPSGALDKPTTINVKKRLVEQQVQLYSPSGGAPLAFPPATLSVYELTPLDTVLLRPIELALPIPAGQKVFVFVTAKGEHRTLPGVAAGGIVRVSINNFDFNRPGAITLAR
jgi:hypothetical protein